MTDEYRIHEEDLEDLISELRHDAEIGAWNDPEAVLIHYAERLESYL